MLNTEFLVKKLREEKEKQEKTGNDKLVSLLDESISVIAEAEQILKILKNK